ncbi:hypothetical protein U3516DRAFT_761851 [Neocallimastix sp. 'constans']
MHSHNQQLLIDHTSSALFLDFQAKVLLNDIFLKSFFVGNMAYVRSRNFYAFSSILTNSYVPLKRRTLTQGLNGVPRQYLNHTYHSERTSNFIYKEEGKSKINPETLNFNIYTGWFIITKEACLNNKTNYGEWWIKDLIKTLLEIQFQCTHIDALKHIKNLQTVYDIMEKLKAIYEWKDEKLNTYILENLEKLRIILPSFFGNEDVDNCIKGCPATNKDYMDIDFVFKE